MNRKFRTDNKGSTLVMTLVIMLLLSIMTMSLLYSAKRFAAAQNSIKPKASELGLGEHLTVINRNDTRPLPDAIYQFFAGYSSRIVDRDESNYEIFQDFYDTNIINSYARPGIKRVYSKPENYTVARQAEILGGEDVVLATLGEKTPFLCSNIGNIPSLASANALPSLMIGAICFERTDIHGTNELYTCHLVWIRAEKRLYVFVE